MDSKTSPGQGREELLAVNVCIQVLNESGRAMTEREIADEILGRGTVGARLSDYRNHTQNQPRLVSGLAPKGN